MLRNPAPAAAAISMLLLLLLPLPSSTSQCSSRSYCSSNCSSSPALEADAIVLLDKHLPLVRPAPNINTNFLI